MDTGRIELSMDELEQGNGGGNITDNLLIKIEYYFFVKDNDKTSKKPQLTPGDLWNK